VCIFNGSSSAIVVARRTRGARRDLTGATLREIARVFPRGNSARRGEEAIARQVARQVYARARAARVTHSRNFAVPSKRVPILGLERAFFIGISHPRSGSANASANDRLAPAGSRDVLASALAS